MYIDNVNILLHLTWGWTRGVSPWNEDQLAVGVKSLVKLDGVIVRENKVTDIASLDLREWLRAIVSLITTVRACLSQQKMLTLISL